MAPTNDQRRQNQEAQSAKPMTENGVAVRRLSAKLGKVTLSWLEAGSGTPVVLLHGIGSWAESWRPLLPLLSGDFRMIAWDMPGYGGSSPLSDLRPTAAPYAELLSLWLKKLGISEAHIVGHSLGALVAAEFASRYPDAVRSLVLASPAAGYASVPGSGMLDSIALRVSELNELGAAAFAKKRAPNLCAPAPKQAAVRAVEDAMAQVRMPGYSQACWLLSQGDLVPALQQVSARGLVVGAAEDRVVPKEKSSAIAAHWASARYAEIADVGHAGYVEDAAAYVAPIRAFFEEIN